MIYLLVGENEYLRHTEIEKIASGSQLEIFDGSELEQRDLPSIFSGQTLFTSRRVILIRDLSSNKILWSGLETWLDPADTNGELIFSEQSVDKRTKTYKYLQKNAKIVSCDFWRDRDTGLARRWLDNEIEKLHLKIAPELRNQLVERAIRPSDVDDRPVIDQMRLVHALQQLAGVKEAVSVEQLETILPANTQENVFALLTTALGGDVSRVHQMCQHLAAHEDGFKVFGLLGSQIANLYALTSEKSKTPDQLADELGVSAFALRSLSADARKVDIKHAAQFVRFAVAADRRIKLSAEPWSVIETLLQKIALH